MNVSLPQRILKILSLFFNEHFLFLTKIITKRPFNRVLPDKLHIGICYRGYTGMKLNLKNPGSFNEKTQWLKLYDRQPWYQQVADKSEVRNYVKVHVGEEYLIPLLGLYNSVEEIDFEKLPEQFVLKCTHDSGSTIICENKASFQISQARSFLRKKLNRNFYYMHREFQYKHIKPRIVCEEFISSNGKSTPIDYKFFCFHGVPRLIQVDTDRFLDHGRLTLYPDWTPAPFHLDYRYVKPGLHVERPANLNEMLEVAARLSTDFKFVRVDLYSVNDRVYFGELTQFQGSGYNPIRPREYDGMMGEWLDISGKTHGNVLNSQHAPEPEFKKYA